MYGFGAQSTARDQSSQVRGAVRLHEKDGKLYNEACNRRLSEKCERYNRNSTNANVLLGLHAQIRHLLEQRKIR